MSTDPTSALVEASPQIREILSALAKLNMKVEEPKPGFWTARCPVFGDKFVFCQGPDGGAIVDCEKEGLEEFLDMRGLIHIRNLFTTLGEEKERRSGDEKVEKLVHTRSRRWHEWFSRRFSTAPATVDPTATIIDNIAQFVERFVFLPDKALYHLIALWIVGTHLLEHFEYFGYLFAHSPEKRSGKSRLLEVGQLLVKKPSEILLSPTMAVLFRTAQDFTQLLDEVDSWTNGDELKSFLNSAYHEGGVVSRVEQNENGKRSVENFPVYTAVAMAGIGTRILHPTTRDRTFMIGMIRQKKNERREKLRRRTKRTAFPLQAQIRDWVQQRGQEVAQVYDAGDFPYLDALGDRTIDVAEPLAAVFEVVYKDHPRGNEARSEFLEAISAAREDEQTPTRDHEVLKELLRLAETENPLIGNATELSVKFTIGASPEDISRVLRKYGFTTKSLRRGDSNPLHRYKITHEALADLVVRYAGGEQVSAA